MCSYRRKPVVLLATLRFFFFVASFCSGTAYGATHTAVNASAAIAAAQQGAMRYYRQLEQQSPKGSRVYGVDQFVILDGNDSLIVFVDTSFHRDRTGALYATNIDSGHTWKFSPYATVTRSNNSVEMIERPGETDPVIQRLIQLGGARIIRVVGSLSVTEPVQPDCPLYDFPSGRALKCGPPPPRWVGGGPGTIYGAPIILTAISNSCAIRGESLVYASYTVPSSSYASPIQASLCGGPSGHNICVFVPKLGVLSAPATSHQVSVTLAGGGDFGENLAFNGATVQSASLPGCYYQASCT